jgi:putative glutamine amidotransferase
MVKRSVIGIAGNETHTPRGQIRCDIPYDYVRAVEEAGGIPLVLPQMKNLETEALDEQLQRVHGVILPGGGDVAPLLWGEESEPGLGETFPFLDSFQMALTRRALEKNMPLLGICKGLQILNVVQGGTLVQDLAAFGAAVQHTQRASIGYPSHSVILQEGSLLRSLWGERVEVNSFHHQAVREPGRELRVTARSADGVIEALEMPDRAFVVGVQWHPEGMVPQNEKMGLLFRSFIEACGIFARA